MKSKRTVSAAGECYALPFMVKNNCVVDANNQKVAEVGTASSARWLAQVLNEHFYINDNWDVVPKTRSLEYGDIEL